MGTILQTVNLIKDYDEGKVVVNALKGVNLEIEKGEFTEINETSLK